MDANVLLYSADTTSPFHSDARELMRSLAEAEEIFYLFWPVALAYLRISTRSGVFAAPLALDSAVADIDYLLSLPNVRASGEGPSFWEMLKGVFDEARPRGNLLTDAHIVALMRMHEVDTIFTHDRDFRRFDGIRVVDPFR